MTKPEIITAAELAFTRFSETCNAVEESRFFKKPGTKWSVAENVQHLIISTKTSSLAWWLPKFLVRWIGGRPNRGSRSFAELKAKYYQKLSDGAVASSRFVPKPIAIHYGKTRIMDNWQKATSKFTGALTKNRTENDLDNYLVKHPLLGRITLRELCYFTIFHTEHHLESIQKMNNAT